MPSEQDDQGSAQKREPEQSKTKSTPTREERGETVASAKEAADKGNQGRKAKSGDSQTPSGWSGWWRRPDYVFSFSAAFFTLVLAVLTGVYVWTTVGLWNETRASVETATATLRLAQMSQRPWVVVDSISTQRREGLEVIAIIFTNTGTIPAINGQVKLYTWLAAGVDHPGGPEAVRESVDAAEPRTGVLLAPDQRATVVIPYEHTDGEIRWRQSGPVLAVAGAYLYLDASEAARELRFCFWREGYDLRKGDPWEPCPYHNSST